MIVTLIRRHQRKPNPSGPIEAGDMEYPYTVPSGGGKVSLIIRKNGVLVRSAINGEQKAAGDYKYVWDGNDNDGVQVAAGVYDVVLTLHNMNAEWEGVAGNTSYKNEALKSRLHKGLDPINDMCFTTSRMYTVRGYGEGSTPVGYAELSNVHERIGIFNTTQPGPPETQYCDTDGTLLYLAGFDPYQHKIDASVDHSFVYAAKISDNLKHSFSSGQAPTLRHADLNLYGNFASNLFQANSKITGLAVQKTGNHLFVARETLNQIQVVHKTTGAFIRNIAITSPRDIKEKGGYLYVITNNVLKKYTIGGDGTLTEFHTFTGLVRPRKAAISNDDNTILVVDNSLVKIFQNGTHTLLRTVGAGDYSTSSEVDGKLYIEDERGDRKTFAAYQTDGSYWIGDGGNFAALKFNSIDTQIDKIQYIPRLYQSDKVLNADHRKIMHDGIEIQTGVGVYKDSWEQTNHWGYNLQDENFNQFVGIKSPVFIDGKTFALVSTNGTDSSLQTVELVEGGNIRFGAGSTFGFEGQFYADGSFRYMVEVGSNMQYWRRDYTGLSGGNMTHAAAVKYLEVPKLPVRNGGTFYNAGEITSDGTIIACESTDREGYHLAGYNSSGKLLFKTLKSNSPTYRGSFPEGGVYELGNRTIESQAGGPGDKAMVYQNLIFVHYFGEFWGGTGGQTNIVYVFNSKGTFLFQFGYAQPPNQQDKPVEKMAGNAFSPFLAYENGNLYLYHNDEGAWAGLHRWLIEGLDTLTETTGTITVPTSTTSTPPNYRTGLTTTNHLSAIKSRIESNTKFAVKSDVKTNSPGIIATLKTMADQLVNNPLIDRYTGPTGTGQITVGAIPEPGNKGSRVWAAAFLGKMTNNQTYITAAKTALLDFLAQPINQFPDYDAAWPNGTRWRPNTLSDLNPLFIISQYFKKYVEAFDLIRREFNTTQDAAFVELFDKFALFTARETNGDLDPIWTNRNVETNKHAEGYIFSGDYTGSQRKMFDGSGTPKASLVSLYLNNRRSDKLLTCLQVGILTNNDYLISSAYVFVKEWLKFGCYPYQGNVYPGEMERASESGFRDKGFSYSVVMVGLMLEIAHLIEIYKKNPVTGVEYPSLKTYTTTDGYSPSGGYSSAGGPKGLYAVGKTVLKMCNKELNITYNGEAIDGYRSDWEFTEDTTLAAGLYLMYKDEWFKKSALREHPGNRQFPSGGNGSGAYKPYEGFGGGQWWLLTRLFDNNELNLY
jgi:hypothetical protein